MTAKKEFSDGVKLIDGKALAEKTKDEIVKEIVNLGDERPNLAIILVGEREDSKLYVSLKEKQAKAAGIDTHLYKCDADISEDELLAVIDYLNADDLIDAILIQLPLPEGFDTDRVVARMDPAKDVDGFHPENLKKLVNSCDDEALPPLLGVILEILNEISCTPDGKRVTALVNSELFGNAIKHVLECKGAEVTVVHADDPELVAKTNRADILISALGKPKFIKAGMVKEDAVIIDIGISQAPDGAVVGDVDAEAVEDKAGYLTPVPGGVGPMTIAMAFKSTLYLHKKRRALR